LAILQNTSKSASAVLLKVLNSAAANAENNMNLSKSDLFVAEAYANQGPTLKRIMPRAKGRAYRILKRTSHITVVLDTAK
jgi:large subunit ribosomal protein L22